MNADNPKEVMFVDRLAMVNHGPLQPIKVFIGVHRRSSAFIGGYFLTKQVPVPDPLVADHQPVLGVNADLTRLPGQ